MKKSDLKLLQDRMQKALEPPRKPKPDLSDELSSLFDDGTQLDSERLPVASAKNPEPSPTQARVDRPRPEATQTNPDQSQGQDQDYYPSIAAEDKVPNKEETQTRPRPARVTQTDPTQPRPTGPRPTQTSAPIRDFNKRANSLEREALPGGLFPGSSKKLYDALYLRTIGAVNSTRLIQATRRELSAWSGIRNVKTINANVQHLTDNGLIVPHFQIGDPNGSIYEVFLPGEGSPTQTNPDQTQTSQGNPDLDQKTVGDPDRKTAWAGLGNPVDNKVGYGNPNTFFKTYNSDDEAFHQLTEKLRTAAREITGSEPGRNDSERWAEVADVLVEEMKEAAARTRNVSSAPAFLAAHLRRCFAARKLREDQEPKQSRTRKGRELNEVEDDPVKPDLSKAVEMFKELMTTGDYTVETLTTQFGAGYSVDDWKLIIESLQK